MTQHQLRSLIIGAALAVLHQIEMGLIAQHRSGGYFDDNNKLWDAFANLKRIMRDGDTPSKALLESFPCQVKDGLAHLRQSMHITYDEWFTVFPWLENW